MHIIQLFATTGLLLADVLATEVPPLLKEPPVPAEPPVPCWDEQVDVQNASQAASSKVSTTEAHRGCKSMFVAMARHDAWLPSQISDSHGWAYAAALPPVAFVPPLGGEPPVALPVPPLDEPPVAFVPPVASKPPVA